MGDLNLKGTLNLAGMLTLNPSGGKVLVNGVEALVVLQPGGKHGDAPPVLLPPPPAAPADNGTGVVVISSFNQTVKAGAAAIVTQGMVMQGNGSIWPGMVLPSVGNATVTINRLHINVKGDQAAIFPSGGMASLSTSGQ